MLALCQSECGVSWLACISLNISLATLQLARQVRILPCSDGPSISAASYKSVGALQADYNADTGLWNSTGWWNAANCITMLANYGMAEPVHAKGVAAIMQHTYNAAAKLDAGSRSKALRQIGSSLDAGPPLADPSGHCFIGDSIAQQHRNHFVLEGEASSDLAVGIVYPGPFLNDFYDDEAWWALAWIRAFDMTHETKYLVMAASIFSDLVEGQNATCGGIWWNKAHAGEVAITNSLFIETAAALGRRQQHLPAPSVAASELHPGPKEYPYTAWALSSYTWFAASGLLNARGLINDGLTGACANNNGTEWSYNQGAHISALVELHGLLGLEVLLHRAHRIANATIAFLTDASGILHDPCEPNCYPDGTQFKGVFMRGLARLHALHPMPAYAAFIRRNAESILRHDYNDHGLISVNWAGPWVHPPNSSTVCAGLDALVAALPLSGDA